MLSQRELNRALLARQLLLDRAQMSLPRAIERIGGLQAQYAPSMYIGLWSRLEGFERAQLTRALERRGVVQGTLMRSTIHLVCARDYWPFAVAIRQARRESWLRVQRDGQNADDMAAAAETLRAHMAGGTMRRVEIQELLGKPRAGGVGLWVDLVRAPPSGTWERRRADLYALADDWLASEPVARQGAFASDDAVMHLVRSYLRGFGPASRKDIASYAGLPLGAVESALGPLQLRRFRGEGGHELLDLPRAPLPDPETPAPVRLLPTWDATLLVHARRTGILPEPYRPRVFSTKTPHSVTTFLVDGAVAGTWRYEKGRVEIEPFARLDRSTERELREETDRVTAFHA